MLTDTHVFYMPVLEFCARAQANGYTHSRKGQIERGCEIASCHILENFRAIIKYSALLEN